MTVSTSTCQFTYIQYIQPCGVLLFTYSAGDYWFWVPWFAGACGTLVFVTIYHVMISNHLQVSTSDQMVDDKSSSTAVSIDKCNGIEEYSLVKRAST